PEYYVEGDTRYGLLGYYSSQTGQYDGHITYKIASHPTCDNPYLTSDGGAFTFIGVAAVSCPAGWQSSLGSYCSRPKIDCCNKRGNPIDVNTSAKVQSETDLAQVGTWTLPLRRAYNSQGFGDSPATSAPGAADDQNAVLGQYWHHNYQRRLVVDSYTRDYVTYTQAAHVYLEDGTKVTFNPDAAGIWKPRAWQPERLTQLKSGDVVTGWRFVGSRNEIEGYGADGRLQYVQRLDGATQTLRYSDGSNGPGGGLAIDSGSPLPAGMLLSVSDDFGRNLQFGYLSNLRLARVTTSGGDATTFDSDGAKRLTGVRYADGQSVSYLYQASLGGLVGQNLLTGIIDENGVQKSSYAYDASGRATSTELAGGVGKFTVAYPWATVPTGNSVVVPITDPVAGVTESVTLILVNGAYRRGGETRPAGAGSPAASSSFSYDGNGNVASADDFNGTRTCYVFDQSRNLETARVEGLANSVACSGVTPAAAALPSGARKISTQWHPLWRRETRRAEPKKITTFVYNGQPDPIAGGIAACAPADALLADGSPTVVLCKRVEQATTDGDGSLGFSAVLQSGVAPRSQSWTYNRYGQVLASKGPRTDIDETTVYEYYATTTADYTIGDLMRVTNPAGQTTPYVKYNAYGQVLRSLDANGVVTDSVFDQRQRLTSSTVGGYRTTYDYDYAGQLLTVTQSDRTQIGYVYDAAHRLTKMTDQSGNSITYVLDNAGNRTQEQVRDPSGTLARAVTRVYDALNRLQQSVGAPN
ncbi:MAG: DUF6531 domain-containing protein, partial [Pseudomonadota bacterium]|nr:DUF6531 domain-containing protein [Pseudomonadota bacterium]